MFLANDTEFFNLILLIFAIGIGWIILRFLLKLARKIFTFGCISIVLVGLFLIIRQYL